jgi:hypothetical protein
LEPERLADHGLEPALIVWRVAGGGPARLRLLVMACPAALAVPSPGSCYARCSCWPWVGKRRPFRPTVRLLRLAAAGGDESLWDLWVLGQLIAVV